METRRFRHFTRIHCHWIFTLGMGLFWGCLTFGMAVDEEAWRNEESELRFVERELLLLEAGRDGGFWLEWWTDQDSRQKTIKQLTAIIVDHEESPQVLELREYLNEPESGFDLFSEAEEEEHLRWFILAQFPWALGFVGAFFALWMVRGNWQAQGRIWRVTGAWSPLTVLSVFFLAEIVGELVLYDAVAGWFYAVFGEDWGALCSSLLWRAAPALLAAFALVGSWLGIVKVYGRGAVRWRLVAGCFCVIVFYESLQGFVGGESEVIDPSDFLGIVNPGAWDLFYDTMDGVVFAPVFEELMFRGVLFLGIVKRLGPVPAALISSVLFAVVHTQYDLWEIVSVGVFGLACCWLAWRTGSIKSGIVLHMIYNGLITAWVYLAYQMPL